MSVLDTTEALTEDEAVRYIELQRKLLTEWVPLPHQIPPADDDWLLWLLLAGRGAGKTDACAHYVNEHVNGPPCFPGGHRVGIIAPTLGDVSDACVNGPSGLRAHNPDVQEITRKGGTYVIWPNGSEAKEFGAHTADDVERLRAGGNRCLVWCEELAAWRQLEPAWQHMRFGLRVGARPHVVASTTPKPRKHLIKLIEDPRTRISTASTKSNPHLAQSIRDDLLHTYGNTRLGRQELDAELLTEVEGALWTQRQIDDFRVRRAPEDLVRIIVGVDPSGGSTDDHDEQGILIAAKGADGHGYVLADRSCRESPDGWGRRAVQGFVDFEADKIVAEKNYGGEMVEAVVNAAAKAMGVSIAYKPVNASRGKRLRAEPIHQLYEQGLIHHVGTFPELEDQQTEWVPESGKASPDRLDALVWALTELFVRETKSMAAVI